nr:hypothetical protein [Tanacetum cinerariifolium]
MIAYLEYTGSNAEFHQIMDFLTLSSIHHSLTVSPTIYASDIKQFWNTVTSQTINDEKQTHAIVDGKAVIFENLLLMGYEGALNKLTFQKALFSPQWNLVRAATTTSLDAQQDSSNITKTQSKATLNEPTPQGEGSGSGSGRQDTTGGHTVGSEEDMIEHEFELTDPIPQPPHDSPLSGGHTPGSDEGRPNIDELMNLCTQLSNMFFALEQFKTAQDLVIQRLLKKVKRLEKKQRARTPGMKLFKIDTSKKKTLDKENVSKQGRDESNKIEKLNISDKESGETEVFDYTTAAEKDVNAAEPVSTAGDAVNDASVILDVSVVGPSTSTTGDIFEDEMITMANTLMAIRRTRPKTTSVVIHDVEEEPRRATPPPIFEREQRIAREKATEQEAKDTTLIEQMENVQPRIDADALLAERIQQEEREQFTVDEQARIEQQAKSSKKRSRVDHDKESVKKQKLEEDDAEKKELRACLDIVPVDDIAIDVESLAIKQDIMDLYRLVKERYETASPKGYDLLLWGDHITLFEPSEEDEMLSRMLNRRLENDHESEMAFELIRFIKTQIKE